ncbi:CotH kinase family protein [Fibrobacter sp.]|uniref:CotH kinase family protein n=1 Tax=Fibrobacter sp. TaxID=35828 RepID=UPI0025BB2C14|nr:CotH kinase family protein [Fibrobacter sp.]
MFNKSKIFFFSIVLAMALPIFAQSYDLPLIIVNTQNRQALQKGADKIPATMSILDKGTNSVADSSKGEKYNIGIKIRGQTSADFPKKGYGIELKARPCTNVADTACHDTSLKVLGMPKNADWVFHGPYVDKTLIRNALAYWLYQRTGRYSSRFKFFELYLNGQYKGVYLLLEKIKRAKARVHIAKLKDEDISGDDVTGGYVLSIDKVENNSTSGLDKEGFKSKDGSPVVMRSPKKENTNKAQQDYIKNFFNSIEQKCDNGDITSNGCLDILDIEAAVDYIIHEDVTNNTDAYICSFYMFKDKDSKGGKLQLGAPWDFNLAFGAYQRVGGEKADGWRIPQSAKSGAGEWFVAKWIQNLWSNNTFQQKYKERWAKLRSGVWHTKNIDKFIDSLKTVLKNAANRNFERWPNLGQSSGTCDADPMESGNNNGGNNGGMWGGWGGGMGGFCMGMKMNYYNEPTWDAEIEHLRKYVKQRFAWIDQQMSFSEPASPVVTEALIIDDWNYYDKDDDDNPTTPTNPSSSSSNTSSSSHSRFSKSSSSSNPGRDAIRVHQEITRLNFYTLNENRITVQSERGGMFRLMDFNGNVLFEKQIPAGTQSFQIPRTARNQHWVATLNGKMISR